MTKQYRPVAGIMLINQENKVFIGRRIDFQRTWQMPQGGINPGETPREAAYRELDEETGVTKEHVDLIAEHPEWINYLLPQETANTLWDGIYQGLTQKWFVFRFLGQDSDINLSKHIPEFSTHKWVSLKELQAITFPLKPNLYKDVVSAFSDTKALKSTQNTVESSVNERINYG